MIDKFKIIIFKCILLNIFLLITITAYILNTVINKNTNKNITNKFTDTHDIIINNILSKEINEDINKDFLEWIYKSYGHKAIVKLNNEISNNTYSKNSWHNITGNSYLVLKDLFNNYYDNINNYKIINKTGDVTLDFIGDVSLADNWYVMPKYDERNKKIFGILSEDTINELTKADITIANNEFTISDRGTKMPGKAYTFRASPKRIPIYEEMGVDLLTLANNHVYDFGEIAFNDMIDSLNEYNMPYIGAGKNINEAKKPYYFIINGYKISFVNATRAEKLILTPEATNTTSGVFRCYDPTNFINLIKEEKEKSDYVIALIHWGREDSHYLEQVQKDTSKQYIDAGADAIIGSHAHVLQGIEFYKNKPIIYNLGDFIFNSESKETGIFQIKLLNDGNMNYKFIPAYQSNEYTKILYNDEKQKVINNMNSWSINAIIDNDGIIKEK